MIDTIIPFYGTLTCSKCDSQFPFDLPIIVNIQQSPNLFEQILSDSLHIFSCPNCTTSNSLNYPVLIYRPNHKRKLVFSPSANSLEPDSEFRMVVSSMKNYYSENWSDSKLSGSIVRVRRSKLSKVMLSDELMEDYLEQLGTNLSLLQKLILAEPWEGTGRILKDYPQLLKPEIEDMFEEMIVSSEGTYKASIKQYLDLILQSKEIGISAAVQEKINGLNDLPTYLEKRINHLLNPPNPNDYQKQINLCRELLEVVDRVEYPFYWGIVKSSLAANLLFASTDPSKDLLIEAHHHNEEALKVHRLLIYPEKWAFIQSNLGIIHQKLSSFEKKKENMEKAIFHCKEALNIFTLEQFPSEWAGIQYNLGTFYSQGLIDHSNDHVESAIFHLKESLKVYSKEDYATNFVMTKKALSHVYTIRTEGTKEQNLKLAINHLQNAINAVSKEDNPETWADLHHYSTSIFLNNQKNYKSENIEIAIYHAEQGLSAINEMEHPGLWAILQQNLGIAFYQRIEGNSHENLERSIKYLQSP